MAERKLASPIYAFGITWLLGVWAFFASGEAREPFTYIIGLLFFSTVVSGITWVITALIRMVRRKKVATPAEAMAQAPVDTGVTEEYEQVRYLGSICFKIADEATRETAVQVSRLATGIFRKVEETPRLKSATGRFFSYYVPSAIKVIEKYHQLESQPIQIGNCFPKAIRQSIF